jgi:hypothetical protein
MKMAGHASVQIEIADTLEALLDAASSPHTLALYIAPTGSSNLIPCAFPTPICQTCDKVHWSTLHCVMPLQPIEPEDARVGHKTAVLNGNRYHYLYGVPADGRFHATVFLVSASLQPAANAL